MIMNKDNQRQRIGQRIKEIRPAAGVSQAVMAAKLGTTG
jgi:DNA-binding transcriptional regulator YiaG